MDTHDVPTTKAPRKNRQWILDARPIGKLTGKEFRWHEASIPQPSNGQVLIETSGCRSIQRSASGCGATPTYQRFRLARSWRPSLSGRYWSRVILTSRQVT